MQNVVRRARFPPKNSLLGRPTRRYSLKRAYTTGSGSSQGAPRRQNTIFLLTVTALSSATSGYLLATHESQKSGSIRGTEAADAPGLDYPRYGNANDFSEAIEELKATFPEPGAVSDDPDVLAPYGFSQNDYHPGIPCFLANVDSC